MADALGQLEVVEAREERERDTLIAFVRQVAGGHLTKARAVIRAKSVLRELSAGLLACAAEQECEWQPWCRMHGNCRRKVEQERTAKHATAAGLPATGAVYVCSRHDAACVEVPPARRCVGCPAMPAPGVMAAPADQQKGGA